jgi:iron complex outermembrane receptor protein
MKIILVNLLLFCILQNASGQVSGKLTAANNQPIPFANILLLTSRDTSLVKAGLTNESGVYRFENILPGSYILRLSSAGYQSWDSPVFELSDLEKSKDFGVHIMKENAKELGEVVLRSEKPLYQQKPEGTIVNVENSLLTKGSTALQVLERSPGVVINHRDNSIELNGKSGVMVMLNGKLIRLSMEQVVSLLDGMSADDIATIELLTTPPASYDAEGSAGLINIVLRKNKKQGTNGSVSLTAGYGYGEKGTGSISLSHNKKDISLHGSYTFSHNRTYSNMHVISAQNMPFMGGDVFVTGWFTTDAVRNNHDATVGLDIKLNPGTTIGSNITYNNSKNSPANFTNAGYNVLPDSLLQFTGDNKGAIRWNNLISSIYMEKLLHPGEKINVDLDYLYFNNDIHSEVQSSFINKHGMQAGSGQILFAPRQKGLANTTIQVGVVKMDYSKQLSKKVKLETGIKGAYTQSSSISGIQSLLNGVWTSSDQTSNHILMKEGIGALYASVNSQINQSANLVIGARYEYSYNNMDNSKTGGSIVKRKLGALFPSVFFSKKINDESEWQLSYTKRISRPSYNDLASYVWYSDPTAVYTGNPFLKPTITHNIKLGYNYKSYSFSLLFSTDDNAIVRYQLTESPARDMLLISPQNLKRLNTITFQTSLPLWINNWWTMNYGFVGGLRQYKASYTKHPFEKTYFGYSLNFNQAFKMPGNFSAELSGLYHSLSYDGSKKIEGFGVLNAGIKKELEKNGGSFQLSVSDILRQERYIMEYGTLTEEAFSIKSHVAFYPESAKFPIIKLSYSRFFGNNKVKAKGRAGTNDEQERIMKD